MAAHHPIHDANERSPFGDLTREEFYRKHKVRHSEFFMLTDQKKKLFTQSWRPEGLPGRKLRGFVAMVHGYVSESSWVFQLTAVAIAKLGFHVCALDLRGHGFSDGPRDQVPDVDVLVDDCIRYFDAARSGRERLPAFLYGESLGGAIALLVCLRQRGRWSGLVLNGAMCGVSPEYKPPWPLEAFLPAAALVAPNWRVSITQPLVRRSYKEEWKRRLVVSSPNYRGPGKAPAATALEFLRVCRRIRRRCGELEVPILAVHGGGDSVCDTESARRVVERAGSADKTLEVLPGMWHQLIGEPEGNVEAAFGVIFRWLEDRAGGASSSGAGKHCMEARRKRPSLQ
uniref:Monoglyceride lipase n=1 Tax=Anthurium amnicola TaxID=1678845 RepID=A0A1D1Y986_9ARAE